MDQQSPVKPYDAVVFDLDGTLIDSAPDIHAAINHVLAEKGYAPLSLPDVTGFIGNGVARLVERAFHHRQANLGADGLAKTIQRFTDIYAGSSAVLTRPYPGVAEALDVLNRQGVKLGVCTNKPEALARSILDELGLGRHFKTVIGGDSCRTRKPNPEPLLACLDQLGGAPPRALYIGDSATDVQTARAAGMPVLLVTYGYTTTRPADLGADGLIDRLDDWARRGAAGAGGKAGTAPSSTA